MAVQPNTNTTHLDGTLDLPCSSASTRRSPLYVPKAGREEGTTHREKVEAYRAYLCGVKVDAELQLNNSFHFDRGCFRSFVNGAVLRGPDLEFLHPMDICWRVEVKVLLAGVRNRSRLLSVCNNGLIITVFIFFN